MTNKHVLIVEDEQKIAELLADYLKADGYKVSILLEGTNAVETVQRESLDFLILDLMLPGKDGLSICREVRQFSNLPIMMLTARVDEIDRLLGLELGADDYVCKPFLPREVVARVKSILRRTSSVTPTQTENVLSYRDVTLNLDKYQCLAGGVDVELTPVEFRMLKALMSRPGRVFSRDSLMTSAYTDDRVVSDRTIDSHIKNLRKKVLAGASVEELIHSIYGVGYKIE
ncbi:response regulator [Paraferrimonas sedimenticola]|uniref:DNA-binding response regulator n=1 Tax=Paraferrimonas sedimenticola TaxID=375674 RepID=A0AA37W0F2_9GAMM|nr:response regulator [Paraferrimonas sedimenticola]GLP95353.1 DNA-binding response regulator [Paraferrimonas sedimenticola]